jgi:hypothetical protein
VTKLTKDSGRMAGIEVRVTLGWVEEGNSPKKSILKDVVSNFDIHVHVDRLAIVICIPRSTKKRTRHVRIISNYCD